MVTNLPLCSAPFDAIAGQYDDVFTTSRIGRAQRESVWRELERRFPAGSRLLEIGCGTGVDACFLAERGIQVIACDNSPGMIAVATRRIRQRDLQKLVKPILCNAEDLSGFKGGCFDGAFSNFGAVNCVPDLRILAGSLKRLLKPGAPLLLCCLGPCCWWEIVWYLASGQPRKAFRRLRHRDTAQIAGGPTVQIYYPTVRTIARMFAPSFRLKSAKGIGLVVPPSYMESWVARFPRWLDLAVRSDLWLARCPGIRLLSDHLLLEFEHQST